MHNLFERTCRSEENVNFINGVVMEIVTNFCYIGNILRSCGDVAAAVGTSIRKAWKYRDQSTSKLFGRDRLDTADATFNQYSCTLLTPDN